MTDGDAVELWEIVGLIVPEKETVTDAEAVIDKKGVTELVFATILGLLLVENE